jgi:hypothetical protein
MKVLLSLLVATFSLSAFALNMGNEFHRESLAQQARFDKLFFQGFKMDGDPRVMSSLFFEQKLDHSDPSSTTFKQRYFIDSSYAQDENSPVFYIICGEWNCAGTGSYGYAENLAKKVKAHIVALEHRFYGQSMPTSTLTSENLKHLNLESALEDLASVQRYLMDTKNLKGKWISFGGSYAGTLSAFYRLHHPELVTGALASSGPVFMKKDFFEYDAHIAKVISRSDCGDKVREAVKLIEEKMQTEDGINEVKVMFRSSEISDSKDFLYIVADSLAAAVQYGRDQLFCSKLRSNPDLISGYADGALSVLSAMGQTPMDGSMQIAEKIETGPSDNMRQWMWQSCREFGWFQVANTNGLTSRSSQIDIPYHQEVCSRLFQQPMSEIGSLNTDGFLLLMNPKTSGIIFSNGGNDPWQTLSVTGSTLPGNPALSLFMMDGASHCSDLKANPILPSVMAAQSGMSSIITEWIK